MQQYPPQAGIPIDAEIQRVKAEIEQRRLQLSQVNANMANIRSHYQQSHVHGGGFVRAVQRSSKDAKLRKQQPGKERLQQEKLALEQQLAQLKMLKAQGMAYLPPPYTPQYAQGPSYPEPNHYPLGVQPPLSPQPPKRVKGGTIVAIIVGVLLIGGIINGTVQYLTHPNSTEATPVVKTMSTTQPTQATPLAEHLAFSGDISGVLIAGEEPHSPTHDDPIPGIVRQNGDYFDPAPNWTQCSDFNTNFGQAYIAVIVGKAGAMHYAVTIEINPKNPAYTNPGTALLLGNANSDGRVEVYEMGGKNRRWQQVYGPDQQNTVIVLHADRSSGTIDAWMATTDQSQKSAESTLHLQGDWRCG